jgi:hypothetical protein
VPYKDIERRRELQRDWYQRNAGAVYASRKAKRDALRAIVSQWKLDRGCQRCGYNRCAAALDLHHAGDKVFMISAAIKDLKSIEAIKDEFDRCELICANCHREEHNGVPFLQRKG